MSKNQDRNIPLCLGPEQSVVIPQFEVPEGAWDTHFHVFGPTHRFPYADDRRYTPPESPYEAYLDLMNSLRIERGVCVHPNLHGPDNAVTLDAIERSDGRLLGIVKVDRNVTLTDLKALQKRGIVGVRFAFNPEHGSSELDIELFARVAGWCQDLGWCISLHFASSALDGLAELIAKLTVPTVIDHFARIDPSKGVDQPEFRTLLDLMRLPNLWVKLTGADRITRQGPPYEDVVPLARALISLAPDRCIWGTDWPHSGIFEQSRMPNDGDLLNLLTKFAPTAEQRFRILVENPNRLFSN